MSHVDRIIVGGLCLAVAPLTLEAGKGIGAGYFLDLCFNVSSLPICI